MRKIWNVRPLKSAQQQLLTAELGISPIIAQVLLNRGITTPQEARQYLHGGRNDVHDAFLLKDMDKAAARVRQAIARREPIVVYGDYDVDGLTSCALLFLVLRELGAQVSCYIPHRIDEGYGVNRDACVAIKKNNAALVITVDCGISSFEEVEYLKAEGIDVIVTDHHQPREGKIPRALAVIDPFQEGCRYPYKELAGVGLAYKLAQAVAGECCDVCEHLDLVALGTISDVAPLTGENRILVKYGLEQLSQTKKIGLKALKEVAGIARRRLAASHVGFILGPRINATGRMGSSEKALQLLLSTDEAEALLLAKALDAENKQRRKEEGKTLKEALTMMEREINFAHHRCVVLHHDEWHPGVIGIVASRIAERFYRPTILISTKEGLGKGSGRSIRNFHLFESLEKCDHLLEEFGGHEKAVGLKITRENIAGFKKVFNEIAHEMLSAQDLIPMVDIDMDITLSALSEKLINDLEQCAPFGRGNSQPVFASRDLQCKGRPRFLRGESLKLWVTDGKVTCEAFGNKFLDSDISRLNQGFSIVYSPSMNDWQGISTIQLKLKDIHIPEPVF
jgi:single-stranded-DNA-specific exonuclease